MGWFVLRSELMCPNIYMGFTSNIIQLPSFEGLEYLWWSKLSSEHVHHQLVNVNFNPGEHSPGC